MKRIILGILCVLISINAFSVSADFYVNGIGYTVLSFSGDLTCELSDGTACSGDITIPETVTYQGRTLKVIMIDNGAFAGTPVTSVILSKSIRSIGSQAFGRCNKLKTITIPESCDDYDSAFENCTSLTSVVILSDRISSYAFRDCSSLQHIEANNVVTVDNCAFDGCMSLTSITLPNATNFGFSCFSRCESLETVVAPQMAYIDSQAFYNCRSLSSVTFGDNIQVIGNEAFYKCLSLSNINFGNSQIENLGEYAFYACSVTSINIPGNVKFGSYAFADCTSLSSIVIQNDVKFNNVMAVFENCPITVITTASPYVLSVLSGKMGINIGNLKKITLLNGFKTTWTEIIDHYEGEGSSITTSAVCNVPIDWEAMVNLEELKSLSLEPPTLTGGGWFSSSQYLHLKVIVPTEALEAYQQADVWKNFWNLQGGATTGINAPTVNSNGVNAPIYDIGGRKVMETVKGQVYIKNGKKFIAR